jgi:hypothetical protein
MAIAEGWDGSIKLGANAIANISNWKVNFVQETHDVSQFGDTQQDREFAFGLRSHTVEFSGFYNGTSGELTLTGYMKKDGAPAFTTISFLTTGAKGYKGTVLVESIGIDSNVDGLLSFTASGKVSGGLSTV